MKKIKPFMDALTEYRKHYDNEGADYSATDLIQPPRIVLLRKRHAKEIEKFPIDPEKELDSFWGTGIHHMFESNLDTNKDYILEMRLGTTILNRYITGCSDIFYKPENHIYDIKQTKAWKKIFSDLHEWEQQLNIYAYLWHLHKVRVDRVSIIAWWKNWEKKNVMDNPKYPKAQIEQLPMKLWSIDRQKEYLISRVGAMLHAEEFEDDALPYCTKDDMWEKASQYAVYKLYPNGKRYAKASRVMYSREDIEKWIKKMIPEGTKYEIDVRPGGRERCENWCECSSFCNQYKEYMEEKENEKSD